MPRGNVKKRGDPNIIHFLDRTPERDMQRVEGLEPVIDNIGIVDPKREAEALDPKLLLKQKVRTDRRIKNIKSPQ